MHLPSLLSLLLYSWNSRYLASMLKKNIFSFARENKKSHGCRGWLPSLPKSLTPSHIYLSRLIRHTRGLLQSNTHQVISHDGNGLTHKTSPFPVLRWPRWFRVMVDSSRLGRLKSKWSPFTNTTIKTKAWPPHWPTCNDFDICLDTLRTGIKKQHCQLIY